MTDQITFEGPAITHALPQLCKLVVLPAQRVLDPRGERLATVEDLRAAGFVSVKELDAVAAVLHPHWEGNGNGCVANQLPDMISSITAERDGLIREREKLTWELRKACHTAQCAIFGHDKKHAELCEAMAERDDIKKRLEITQEQLDNFQGTCAGLTLKLTAAERELDLSRREHEGDLQALTAVREKRLSAEKRADLAVAQLLMVGCELSGDSRLHDESDPRWTPTLGEAINIRQRLEEAVESIECWKRASYMLVGGDPDGARPEHLEKFMRQLSEKLDAAEVQNASLRADLEKAQKLYEDAEKIFQKAMDQKCEELRAEIVNNEHGNAVIADLARQLKEMAAERDNAVKRSDELSGVITEALGGHVVGGKDVVAHVLKRRIEEADDLIDSLGEILEPFQSSGMRLDQAASAAVRAHNELEQQACWLQRDLDKMKPVVEAAIAAAKGIPQRKPFKTTVWEYELRNGGKCAGDPPETAPQTQSAPELARDSAIFRPANPGENRPTLEDRVTKLEAIVRELDERTSGLMVAR